MCCPKISSLTSQTAPFAEFSSFRINMRRKDLGMGSKKKAQRLECPIVRQKV